MLLCYVDSKVILCHPETLWLVLMCCGFTAAY